MKAILMATAATLVTLAAAAQLTEGKIIYERKMNMHKSLPPEAEQMKAMIPEFQTSKYQLSFKGQQSLYRPFVSEDEEMPSGDQGGGGGMRTMRFGGAPAGESFKDYEKDTKTDIRELGPKKYLLDDSLKHYSWKLSADTMTVMGHICHKATTTIKGGIMGGRQFRFGRGNNGGGANDTTNRTPPVSQDQQAVAWFADDIASPSGPDDFGGLPGLILQLNVDNGLLVYTPIAFEQQAGTVKAPSSGKKISREDYKVLSEQQIGNMRRGGGQGGQQVIIRQ